MTKVNIIFDGFINDVDIIAIPDEIVYKINEIGQEFLHWKAPIEDNDYWIVINGEICSVAETDGFIKWLNSTYCKTLEKAYVVSRNTTYCPKYEIIDF